MAEKYLSKAEIETYIKASKEVIDSTILKLQNGLIKTYDNAQVLNNVKTAVQNPMNDWASRGRQMAGGPYSYGTKTKWNDWIDAGQVRLKGLEELVGFAIDEAAILPKIVETIKNVPKHLNTDLKNAGEVVGSGVSNLAGGFLSKAWWVIGLGLVGVEKTFMKTQTKIILAVGGGVVFLGALAIIRKYGMTSQGENPWSIEALMNVFRLKKYFEKARKEIDGKFNSVYRSKEVNNKLAGSSKTSDHLVGAATDIAPGKGWTARTAARHLEELAKKGELGDVAQIIEEYKTSGSKWVHVGWNHPAREKRKLQYLVLLDSKPPPSGFVPA
jgi:hypothetical protein